MILVSRLCGFNNLDPDVFLSCLSKLIPYCTSLLPLPLSRIRAATNLITQQSTVLLRYELEDFFFWSPVIIAQQTFVPKCDGKNIKIERFPALSHREITLMLFKIEYHKSR